MVELTWISLGLIIWFALFLGAVGGFALCAMLTVSKQCDEAIEGFHKTEENNNGRVSEGTEDQRPS